ncbi:MAG TPA: hypothetical protein VLU92_09200 [Candidatus Dormibacteraeota bacterium]|nr:hypothetical protein [Candidatus Dormibacteraeota bacterium]
MRRILGWGFAVLLPLVFLAVCGPAPQAVTYTAYYLVCCTQAELDQPWRPGTTVELSWIVESVRRTTVNPTHKAVATGVLTGPYSDAPAPQSASGATHTVHGTTVAMDDRMAPSATPVATFVLPANVPPGYYNLNMRWDFGDGSLAESDSTVRVGAQ